MTTNYKRKYNLLLHELKHVHGDEILTIIITRWIINIIDLINVLRHDDTKWTKDFYYQKISMLEDYIFNKTINDDYLIDKCIIIINKYKTI